jgi:ABC-type methionine transport system ATPase subunit
MNVVKALADDVAVMESGRVVEHLRLDGSPLEPRSDIARFLLDDEIRLEPVRPAAPERLAPLTPRTAATPVPAGTAAGEVVTRG